jgi:hypothetical protein
MIYKATLGIDLTTFPASNTNKSYYIDFEHLVDTSVNGWTANLGLGVANGDSFDIKCDNTGMGTKYTATVHEEANKRWTIRVKLDAAYTDTGTPSTCYWVLGPKAKTAAGQGSLAEVRGYYLDASDTRVISR